MLPALRLLLLRGVGGVGGVGRLGSSLAALKPATTTATTATRTRPLSLLAARRDAPLTATARLPPAISLAAGFSSAGFKTKTHSGVKKRFRARAGGQVLCKPAGRGHGMHKKDRHRNRSKGAKVVFKPGEKGSIVERVARLGVATLQRPSSSKRKAPRQPAYVTVELQER